MTWRTVVIQSKAKLSYKNNYLIIRNENINMIHLSEINNLIIDSTAVTLTSYLISELLDRKIKVIFCNNQRNPIGEIMPYYGCHNSVKKINEQINWDKEYNKVIWTRIVQEKICNQAELLKELGNDNYKKLYDYAGQLKLFDKTNREGHAAKVYFNSLFGLDFSREKEIDVNIMLNYGYSILLSQFNKEIVNNGLLTQLGMKHRNEFNQFNLSSDLMEPFRPLIDKIVYANRERVFNGDIKIQLLEVLNKKVKIKKTDQYITNAISIYVKSVIKAITQQDVSLIEFFKYEL